MAIQADLFTTAAQVIPTMAIAIIVEQALYLPRVRDSEETHEDSLLSVSLALLIATVGEFFALRALTFTPNRADIIIVWVSLAWLSYILASPVFTQVRQAMRRKKDRRRIKFARFANVTAASWSGAAASVATIVIVITWLYEWLQR